MQSDLMTTTRCSSGDLVIITRDEPGNQVHRDRIVEMHGPDVVFDYSLLGKPEGMRIVKAFLQTLVILWE